MDVILLNGTTLNIIIDSTIYSLDVIHKCFYWYGDKYSVDLKIKGEVVFVELIELSNEGNIELLIPKIKNDLIDFKTREIISKETKNVREILIAKAFSHGDEFDETPPGTLNDPIGFDPSKF